jgi:hypothetical protein
LLREPVIDEWIQAFEMVPDEKGVWRWRASFAEGDEWFVRYDALLRKWNKFVPEYNARVAPRNVGRPLAASNTQCLQVHTTQQGHVAA